jgi:nucleotide-binding universal stress UspA family protein
MATTSHMRPDERTALRPFAHAVCGVDGSEESLVAVRQAKALLEHGGTMELVSVIEPPAALPPAYGGPSILRALADSAEEAVARAREIAPLGTRKVEHGSPAAVILEEAERSHATLVALGSHGRGRMAGILLGSVPTHLLHGAACSVLVARERAGGDAFPRSIVVGTDGSRQATAAVEVAKELGERFDAPVRVLVATGGDPVDVGVLSAVRGLEWSDLPPQKALVAASAEADLVIVGSRGLRGLRALGSVSERVGHAAACSVLVVRSQSRRT